MLAPTYTESCDSCERLFLRRSREQSHRLENRMWLATAERKGWTYHTDCLRRQLTTGAPSLGQSVCRSGNIRVELRAGDDPPLSTAWKFANFVEEYMALQADLTVFVVDDESVIAHTLATILKQSGFRAKAFTNPVEALESADSEAPDLLVSDVMMPEMSGVDLAIQLKLVRPDCKVLLFSGQAATADLLQTARAEGHDFALLSKPVHPTDLLHALRSL